MQSDLQMEDAARPHSAQALFAATERLVARHGVRGVSLRQINEEAGVRNASAVHYHFGSREALLGVVCNRRLAEVNAHRIAALSALTSQGRLDDIRALVASTVYSLSAQLAPRAAGNYCLRFIERYVREFGDDLPCDPERRHLSGLFDAEVNLRRILSYLPEAIVEYRLILARAQALYVLASIEDFLDRQIETHGTVAMKVELLIDAIVAMLQAPISSHALTLLMTDQAAPFQAETAKRSAVLITTKK